MRQQRAAEMLRVLRLNLCSAKAAQHLTAAAMRVRRCQAPRWNDAHQASLKGATTVRPLLARLCARDATTVSQSCASAAAHAVAAATCAAAGMRSLRQPSRRLVRANMAAKPCCGSLGAGLALQALFRAVLGRAAAQRHGGATYYPACEVRAAASERMVVGLRTLAGCINDATNATHGPGPDDSGSTRVKIAVASYWVHTELFATEQVCWRYRLQILVKDCKRLSATISPPASHRYNKSGVLQMEQVFSCSVGLH